MDEDWRFVFSDPRPAGNAHEAGVASALAQLNLKLRAILATTSPSELPTLADDIDRLVRGLLDAGLTPDEIANQTTIRPAAAAHIAAKGSMRDFLTALPGR
ncbi:hypothetical protein V6S02_03500 [Microbacterium sp. CCNWLW134]|uniref:hypothetical protein n=1 Tax=Microbacterium sp. CCNWLW134 TaxID=3122064 RepID=UPI00300FBEEA